jgi:hypothetical protein
MGAPNVNGPEGGAGTVVVTADAGVVVVDVWRGDVGVGDPPEPQAASTSGAAMAAARTDPHPNCSR